MDHHPDRPITDALPTATIVSAAGERLADTALRPISGYR